MVEMIKLEALPKSHPKYKDGLRFTMNVNDFITYHLTYKEVKILLNDLTKLVGKVKE